VAGIRDVSGNVWRSVGTALGFTGDTSSFNKIDTDQAYGQLPLDGFMSHELTLEQTFSRLCTSVGNAGYEAFAWFDSTSIRHPRNFWVMSAGFRITNGAPQQAMITVGDATGGFEVPIWWSSNLQNLTFVSEAASITYPLPFLQLEANALGVPSLPGQSESIEFRALLDPAVIADAGHAIIRIRSAPDGVRVWGTW